MCVWERSLARSFVYVTDFGEYLCLCFLGRNRISLGPVELGEPVLVSMISGNEDELGRSENSVQKE